MLLSYTSFFRYRVEQWPEIGFRDRTIGLKACVGHLDDFCDLIDYLPDLQIAVKY